MEQRNPIPLKDCDGNKIRAASPENRRAVRAGGKPRMDSSSLSLPPERRPAALRRNGWPRYRPKPCWRLAEGRWKASEFGWYHERVFARPLSEGRVFFYSEAGAPPHFDKEVFRHETVIPEVRPLSANRSPRSAVAEPRHRQSARLVQRRSARRQPGAGRSDEPPAEA